MRFLLLLVLLLSCKSSGLNSVDRLSEDHFVYDSLGLSEVSEDDLFARAAPWFIANPSGAIEEEQNELANFIVENQWDMHLAPQGFFYQLLEPGDTTKRATWGKKVKVHYVGYNLNGSKFDSSYDRNEALAMYVGNFVEGWNHAVPMLGVGGRGLFLIPASLAYGEEGLGRMIGPNEHLLFDVSLLAIH